MLASVSCSCALQKRNAHIIAIDDTLSISAQCVLPLARRGIVVAIPYVPACLTQL
jgi:hypothetical protein